MSTVSMSPSSVSFPASESSPYPISNLYHNASRSTHLPFRRISIPSAPSLLYRQSVVSMESFDSMPEERSSPGAVMPAVMRNAIRKSKGRPPSLDPIGKRHSRKKEVRPVDEAREAKRLKIIHEFQDTERAYVEGLDLVYSHFLTPIIASLDTSHPLLSRAELTSVFSNFIDIWNLHRSFFSSLSSLLSASTSTTSLTSPPPPLSPILLSHFPYLSLYSPFVTSFPAAVSSLTSLLLTNSQFASFVAQQEADLRCGKLKLRDWLLTIVQRCPRYLLLLKDLINCTEADDPEHLQLVAVHTLVSKITISLNTSLHTHSQTLSLLALQRSTPNLPFQLITPGRTFLKRGLLLQLERSSAPKEREFLLFSDCLIWLASVEKGDGDLEDWDWNGGANKDKRKSLGVMPPLGRSWSRSEAEILSLLGKSKAKGSDADLRSAPTTPSTSSSKPNLLATPTKKKVRQASNGTEEKWVYKGKADLVDLEVVVSRPMEDGEERRLEVLSPEISFALYALNEQERDEWSTAIRQAKASLLVSLNAMHPNSTLTSSSSTNHLRRSLQALPHAPEEHQKPKRGKVEHFLPAIWIPDAKTESCMRCGRTFGWRRRRHHCRLCGRCVCASCSGKTFFISDSTSKASTKSARACVACYDTVFPLLNPSSPDARDTPISPSNTLTGFPSWLSMPSFALPTQSSSPDALMAIDSPKRALHRIDDRDGECDENSEDIFKDADRRTGSPTPRIRIKSAMRPRGYQQVLEDFRSPEKGLPTSGGSHPVVGGSLTSHQDETESPTGVELESVTGSSPQTPVDSHLSTPWRKEDTIRRHKRFSLPAIALQTTSVTARPNASGEEKSKRFSLVLDGRSSGQQAQSDIQYEVREPGLGDLSSGLAAVKLGELLGRQKKI